MDAATIHVRLAASYRSVDGLAAVIGVVWIERLQYCLLWWRFRGLLDPLALVSHLMLLAISSLTSLPNPECIFACHYQADEL